MMEQPALYLVYSLIGRFNLSVNFGLRFIPIGIVSLVRGIDSQVCGIDAQVRGSDGLFHSIYFSAELPIRRLMPLMVWFVALMA
jgi:hypothetical protein